MPAVPSRSPGRPGVTFEQYEAAYQELRGPDGDPPSQRQIRRYLGTGSNSTLSGYRRRIVEQRSEQAVAPEPGTLDEKLLVRVTQLISQLSMEAAQVADDRVDEIKADAQRRIHIAETTMEKRLQDTALLEHRAKSAETDLSASRKRVDRLDNELATHTKEYQTLSVEHAANLQTLTDTKRQLSERTQAWEVLRAEFKALQASDADKAGQLNTAQTALARLQERHTAKSERIATLETELAENKAFVVQLQSQRARTASEVNTLQEARTSATAQWEQEQRTATSLRIETSKLTTELRLAREQHERDVERMRAELESKTQVLDSLQAALSALTTQGSSTP